MSLTDIQNKLEQKLDALSISLDTLKDQQKALLENADKVKSCISIAAETQVNSLKGRERQLIQQVDVVTAHQKSLIDSQIAKVMHTKGSVAATREILHHCKPENVEALSKIIEGNLSSVRPVPQLKMISVQLDANPLNLSIGSFGHVQLPDTIAHHQSAVIPAKVEEYGDSEHDVLHKSIGDLSSNTTVKVHFPQLSPSGWLASTSQKIPPCIPPLGERKLSKDVSSWLAGLRVSQNLEDNKLDNKPRSVFEFEDHYYFLDEPNKVSTKDNRSRCSSISSSIEIVNCEDTEKESCCMSENNEDNMKSRWLSGGSTTSHKSSPCSEFTSLAVDEEFACQANEQCRSYDSCLCDGYCEALAKERASQNSRWLLKAEKALADKGEVKRSPVTPSGKGFSPSSTGVKRKLFLMEGCDEVLNHMSSIMSSSSEKWLSSESQRKALKGLPVSFNSYVVYKPPSKPWLSICSTSQRPKTPAEVNASAINFSPHSNIWLLRKYKEELKMRQESKVESQEQKKDESPLLVNDLKGALAEIATFMPMISPFSASSARTIHHINPSPPRTTFPFFHSLSQQDSVGKELQTRLKWLANTRSQNPVPGHVDIISRASSFLPHSLLAFAESNLDKWLMTRL